VNEEIFKNFRPSNDEIEILRKFTQAIEYGQDIPKINKKAFNIFKKLYPNLIKENKVTDNLSAVIPLFRIREKKLEQYASGVLVSLNNKIYLLTAFHVLINEKPYMPLDGTIMPINGETNGINIIPRENRRLDFSYIKFTDTIATKIANEFTILREDDLLISERFDEVDGCVFTGYPHRKSKSNNNIISTEFYEYVGSYSMNENIYKQKGCSIKDNIISRFNLEQGTTRHGDHIRHIVHPEGISGGGIFLRNIKEMISRNEEENNKLIGIVHSFDVSRRLMIGTKIEVCLEYMSRKEKGIKDVLLELGYKHYNEHNENL
jgi:hypothetical protein